MTKKTLLIVLAAATTAVELKAEPYTTVVGDKTVTSVTRPRTRGLGISHEELLRAARGSVPIVIVPSGPTRQPKVK